MAKRQAEEKSRAEKIRARRQHSRQETTKTPIGGSATRKQVNSRVPITSRTAPYRPSQPVRRKRQALHVPLSTMGAELQIPSVPRLNLGWRLISSAIFLFSLAVVISMTSLDTFKINSITLRGAERLSGEAILSQIDLAGTSIIRVRPQEIETRIEEQFPGLKTVSVSLRLPATAAVRVTERQPLILWQQDNAAYWIDEDGIMFPIFGEAEVAMTVLASSDPPSPPLPVESDAADDQEPLFLMPEITHPMTTHAFVKGLLALRDYVPEGSYLQYDPRFGLGWQDPNGWLVYFGNNTEDIEPKLTQYEHILAALREENITPTLISLDHTHAPFIRLEQ